MNLGNVVSIQGDHGHIVITYSIPKVIMRQFNNTFPENRSNWQICDVYVLLLISSTQCMTY